MENTLISAISAIGSNSSRQITSQVNVGYGASLSDISSFHQSLNNAHIQRLETPSDTERAVAKPLDYINEEAQNIVNYAKTAVESGNELTPSEIIMLTARSHEFMFHCQLTSNIANRTSDGLQQLFRQQS